MHLRFNSDLPRVRSYNGTTLVNVSDRYDLELPDIPYPASERGQVIYKTKQKYSDDRSFKYAEL